MKRYVVAMTGLTTSEEKAFNSFIREKNFGWWHRISNFWLITDAQDVSTPVEIRDFVMELSNSKVGLVIEIIGDDTWAGFAPNDKLDETFAWLEKNWTR